MFIARTISVFGDQFGYVALPFAVLALTHSVALVGSIMAARLTPYIIFLLVGGFYSDRLPRNQIVVFANMLCGICQLLLGVFLVLGTANMLLLIGLNVVYGLAASFFRPAASGIIRDFVEPEQIRDANALIGIGLGSGNIAGPVLGGILVAVAGPGWAIDIDGLSFIISATLLLSTGPITVTSRSADQNNLMKGLAEGWSVVRKHAWLLYSIIYFGIFQIAVLGSFYVIGPFVAARSLGGASAWGIIMTGSGVGALLGGLLVLKIRPQRLLLGMYIALLGVTPVLFLLAAPAPFLAILATAVVWGASFAYGNALWETAMLQHVPQHVISRAVAYDSMVSTVLRPVGLVAFGQLATTAGTTLPLTLVGAGTVCLTLGIMLVPDIRKVLCLLAVKFCV